MTDFMDTALNYEPGVRVAPNAKRWVLTNGIGRLPLCEVCRQPVYEGHVDCTCDKNHPEVCDRPTYGELKARHDALVAALESALRIGQIASKPVIARIEAALEAAK